VDRPFPDRPALCREVAAATPELLSPDRGEPHLVRLRTHLRVCRACSGELAAQSAVIEQLRSLPVASDARKTWIGLRAALVAERLDPSRSCIGARSASAEEYALIAVIGGALAVALVRLSPLAARSVDGVRSESGPWLLPVAFLALGSLLSLLALPLLRRGKAVPQPLRFRPRFR
jgi:hypothetical protein